MQCGNRLQVGYSQLQRTIYSSAKFINSTSSHSILSCLTSSMDRMSSKQSVDNDRTYALYIELVKQLRMECEEVELINLTLE